MSWGSGSRKTTSRIGGDGGHARFLEGQSSRGRRDGQGVAPGLPPGELLDRQLARSVVRRHGELPAIRKAQEEDQVVEVGLAEYLSELAVGGDLFSRPRAEGWAESRRERLSRLLRERQQSGRGRGRVRRFDSPGRRREETSAADATPDDPGGGEQ